jgi:hypothetical protein
MGVTGENRHDARIGVEQREHGVTTRAGVQRLVARNQHVALAGGGERLGQEGQCGLGHEPVGAGVAPGQVEHDHLQVLADAERVVETASIRVGVPGGRRTEARHRLAGGQMSATSIGGYV